MQVLISLIFENLARVRCGMSIPNSVYSVRLSKPCRPLPVPRRSPLLLVYAYRRLIVYVDGWV